jgi:hypothetical protein
MGALIWFATWEKGNGSECFAYYLNWFFGNLVKRDNMKALPAIAIDVECGIVMAEKLNEVNKNDCFACNWIGLFDEFKARE